MFELTAQEIKTYTPKWKSKVNLYPHQLCTVKDIETIEKTKKFYYLADMTGFGKTISLMALIYRTNNRWIPADNLFFNPSVSISSDPTKMKLRDVYITPLHLFAQVCAEAKRCGVKHVSIKTYKGCAREKYADDVDLIILSCTMVASFLKHHAPTPFYRIIVDEADTITFRNKYVPLPFATYRYLSLVSATLAKSDDDNNSDDENDWRWYRYQRPSYGLKRIQARNLLPEFNIEFVEIKNNSSDIIHYFKSNFIVEEYNYVHEMSKIVKIVSKYAPDSANYHLAHGDITQALNVLRTRTKKNGIQNIGMVMRTYLEEKQRKAITDESKATIQKRIDELSVDLDKLISDPCFICMSPITQCTVTPCCQHLLCSECILHWFKNQQVSNSCPMCRSPIQVNTLSVIDVNYVEDIIEDEKPVDEPIKTLTKRDDFTKRAKSSKVSSSINDTIESILKKNPNGKYLIYSTTSYYQQTMDSYVRNVTGKLPFINAMDLPSGVSASTSAINKFHNGNINCLFLDPNHEATGLNCQETTDIIMVGAYTTATIVQIRGRALRLGRDPKLNLRIHLLTYE